MKLLNRSALKEHLESEIGSDIASGKVGGVAVCVLQDHEICYKNYFSDEKNGIHVSEDTLFRLASMTKPVTAAAMMILIDRGMITLDMPICKLLPEFQQMKVGIFQNGEIVGDFPAQKEVTIRHLLTHSSGIGSGELGIFLDAQIPVSKRTTLEALMPYYAKDPLEFEPFTKESYSPVRAFDILARIAELVTGMTYEKFLSKELFLPLGMKNTTFAPTQMQWEQMIPMHNYENGKGGLADFPENIVFEGYQTTCFCGGAGLAATMDDYLNFISMLSEKGSFHGKTIIQESTIDEMTRSQMPETVMPGVENWGLGVRVITEDTYESLPAGSFGWSGAYGTHFWVDLVNKINAIYMKNSKFDGGSEATTARRFEKMVYQSL